MHKRIALLLGFIGLIATAPMQAQQQHRYDIRPVYFNDTESNKNYGFIATDVKTRNYLRSEYIFSAMLLSDPTTDDLSLMRVMTNQRITPLTTMLYFTAGVGVDIVTQSATSDRVDLVYNLKAGIQPKWTMRNPFGVSISHTRSTLSGVARQLRANIDVTSTTVAAETYLNNVTMLSGEIEFGGLTDGNKRATISALGRHFTPSGFFVGGHIYNRVYDFDAGLDYWSPTHYTSAVVQAGYKLKWNNPNWQGQALVQYGGQVASDIDRSSTYGVQANLARKIGDGVWIYGAFNRSQSASQTNAPGYQWSYMTLGVSFR